MAGVVFGADDLASWLIGTLADAGRKKLAALLFGTEQERALRAAATAAIQRTAADLRPGDEQQAAELALVVDHVFATPLPGDPRAGQATLLEALGAGISAQLAVLDDASVTGTSQSSAQVLGIPGTIVASVLTGHLLDEIVIRGAAGGPLFPLASQLNDDVAHLHSQRLEGMFGQLAEQVRAVMARLDATSAGTANTIAGGNQFGTVVQGGQVQATFQLTAPAPTALAQLPPLAAGFTGRAGELCMLAGLLDPKGPAGRGGPVLVSAVAGLPGVGKTTLAVAAAHAARAQGRYSGGVLFVDLHGYDDQAVEPCQALDALLRALAVPAEHIPPSTQQRAGLYRSVLAQIPGPVLVVADNASSEAQVWPLLPGAGPHTVLVTSRHTLAGLRARLIDVTVLGPDASADLLDAALRAARPGDDRITADPQAARQLATACGGLPLALQITAALLASDPALAAAELAGEMAAEPDRLDRLAYDDGSGTSAPSVTAAFNLSYRRLDKATARVFRLLPVDPGPDISTGAAAALTGVSAGEARRVLGGLAGAHLAEPVPSAKGRWRMHDLVRLYAEQLSDRHADADGREQARDRLLGYYLDTADAANKHLWVLPGMTVPARFAGRREALAWLDGERESLVAAPAMAAATGRDHAAMRLPLILAEYLAWRRRFDDWLTIAYVSRDTARRQGDRRGEAMALNNLGAALREVGRFDEAITACQDAAAIYGDTADVDRERIALENLEAAKRAQRA